jgi:hypothetical protein
MIKKFNENLDNFEDYLNTNKTNVLKEFDIGDRVIGIGKDFSSGLDIEGQHGTVLRKVHYGNRYECMVDFDNVFSNTHMVSGPNFKPGDKRKCLWVHGASLKLEKDEIIEKQEDKILFEVGDKVTGIGYYMNIDIDGKSGFIEEIKKTPKIFYLVRFIKPAFGSGKINLLWVSTDFLKHYEEKKIEFDTKSFEIIGLPSGQIIYMNDKQIKYFKSSGLIIYTNIWKKPLSGGFIPIKLGKYVFEDPNYQKIINTMEKINFDFI